MKKINFSDVCGPSNVVYSDENYIISKKEKESEKDNIEVVFYPADIITIGTKLLEYVSNTFLNEEEWNNLLDQLSREILKHKK